MNAAALEGMVVIGLGAGGLNRRVRDVRQGRAPFSDIDYREALVVSDSADVAGLDPTVVHSMLCSVRASALVLLVDSAGEDDWWRHGWPQPAEVPLLIAPPGTRLIDLVDGIAGHVALVLERDGMFARIAHAGHGLQDILNTLEDAIGAAVLLLDPTGCPVGRGRTSHGHSEKAFQQLLAARRENVSLPPATTPIPWRGTAVSLPAGILVGIPAGDGPYTHLHASIAATPSRTVRQHLIEAAATIAIAALRQRSPRQSERVLAEAALVNLIHNPGSDHPDEDLRRLLAWGLTAGGTHHVAAGVADHRVSAEQRWRVIQEIRRRSTRSSSTTLAAAGPHFVVVIQPDPFQTHCEVFDIGRDVMAWAVPDSPVALAGIPAAARTALRAARASLLHTGTGSICTPADIQPWLMLVDLADSAEVRKQADRITAGLVAANLDLIATLGVVLAENCNASAAARRLHLNRHSLLRRIDRIEEITATSLHNPFDRLMLQVCLVVYDSKAFRGEEPAAAWNTKASALKDNRRRSQRAAGHGEIARTFVGPHS